MSDLVSAVIGLALILAAVLIARRVTGAASRTVRRAVRGRRPEDVLTLVAAVIATAVQATGMWRFFGTTLHFSGPLRVLLFAFLEVAVFTSALRARRNVAESFTHSPGIDGIAVWTLTGLSAVLSAMDARSFAEVLFRLAAPLVAAWLWERGMSVERRRITGRSRINWRLTPERILVRLGVAEASDRTASDVDAHRRLHRVAQAAKQLRARRSSNAAAWRQTRAQRRLDRAMTAAVEHAGLADDPDRQDALLAQVGALFNAAALAELDTTAPWCPPKPSRVRLIRGGKAAEVGDQVGRQVGDEVCPRLPVAVPDEPAEDETFASLNDPADAGESAAADLPEALPDPLPEELERLVRRARRRFRRELEAGTTPSVADLKSALRIGQPKAQEVRDYLSLPAERWSA